MSNNKMSNNNNEKTMITRLSAVSLSCDKCHRQFFFNAQHIFLSQEDARARASVSEWTLTDNKDFCPTCSTPTPRQTQTKK